MVREVIHNAFLDMLNLETKQSYFVESLLVQLEFRLEDVIIRRKTEAH